MVAELEPSSSITLLKPDASFILLPTFGLPVNVYSPIFWSDSSHSPTVFPEPNIIFNNPFGRPASISALARLIADKGVEDAGFNITLFLAAIAVLPKGLL